MRIEIRGIGVWGRGMCNWPEFCALVAAGADGAAAQWQAPAPEAIPTRERRRSPLMVKLAVEVACQACDMANVDRRDVASVFGSSMGDGEISDYLCRALASESQVLSPTRFHNSVHNAPAGYWSISAGNRAPSSSIAGSRETFPVALLEASIVSVTEGRPVLLVVSDIFVPAPLGEVYPIGEPFGAALLLDASSLDDDAWTVSAESCAARSPWPGLRHPLLQSISDCNPAARCLALLEAIAMRSGDPIQWPLNDSMCLQLTQATTLTEVGPGES